MGTPRCRKCGKPLRKCTTYHLFRDPRPYRAAGFEEFAPGRRSPVAEQLEKPEGHCEQERGSQSWLIYTANRPRSKAECQRFTNYPITSVRRHYDGVTISAFTAWDGQSYQRSYGHFCTNDCAARFGQIIADGELGK